MPNGTTTGGWFRSYADGVSFVAMEEAMRQAFPDLKETKQELTAKINKKEEYIIDSRGNRLKLPVAVLQEKYIYNTKVNGTEEECNDEVEFTIIQQNNFKFYLECVFDSKGNLYDDYSSSPRSGDSNTFYLRSTDYDDVGAHFSDYIAVWLKQHENYNKRLSFKVPIGKVSLVKRALAKMGVVIIDDENGSEGNMENNNVNYVFNGKPTNEEIEKMISLVDVDTFGKIIKARLCREGETQDIDKFNKERIKEYLETWAVNKYKYFKMFGDKLTIEQEVEVEKDEQEIRASVQELMEEFPLYSTIINRVYYGAFMKNEIGTKSSDWISEVFFKDPRVSNHMKLTKFFSLYGNKELDMAVSKIYQEKGKAHLTISIDPIDYLTVSINKSGWRSCHNFIDGEYRNAGLSYMNDSTSLVSYRSNGEVEYCIERKKFKWNSKGWRQMIYVSPSNSAVVFSRQYPYDSEQLSFNVRQLFEETMSNFYGGKNLWTIYRKSGNEKIKVVNGTGANLYNDVQHGFNYSVVKAKDDVNKENFVDIEIGRISRGVISNDLINGNSCSIW